MYAAADPPAISPAVNPNQDDVDEDDEDEDEADSESEADTVRNSNRTASMPGASGAAAAAAAAEPSELMQLEMSEDIRVGSPDDGSNNLESDFHLLAMRQTGNPDHDRRADSYRAESTRRWGSAQDPMGGPGGLQVQLPVSGKPLASSLHAYNIQLTHKLKRWDLVFYGPL